MKLEYTCIIYIYTVILSALSSGLCVAKNTVILYYNHVVNSKIQLPKFGWIVDVGTIHFMVIMDFVMGLLLASHDQVGPGECPAPWPSWFVGGWPARWPTPSLVAMGHAAHGNPGPMR